MGWRVRVRVGVVVGTDARARAHQLDEFASGPSIPGRARRDARRPRTPSPRPAAAAAAPLCQTSLHSPPARTGQMSRPSVSSLLRLVSSRAGPSCRRSASSRALPKLPYDPLRPLSPEHPPAVKTGFVHPLAKWDSFLDIRAYPRPKGAGSLRSGLTSPPPSLPARSPRPESPAGPGRRQQPAHHPPALPRVGLGRRRQGRPEGGPLQDCRPGHQRDGQAPSAHTRPQAGRQHDARRSGVRPLALPSEPLHRSPKR